MPGQTWPGGAASFVGMWVVMMVAMMLPSLVPMLRRYRAAVTTVGETRLGLLTALMGVGYFFVWMVMGIAAYALGIALAEMEIPTRHAPSAGSPSPMPRCHPPIRSPRSPAAVAGWPRWTIGSLPRSGRGVDDPSAAP
jgi:Predicted metal-binding integral membrane protein (DUF2182)